MNARIIEHATIEPLEEAAFVTGDPIVADGMTWKLATTLDGQWTIMTCPRKVEPVVA